MPCFGVETCAEACGEGVSHGLALGLAAHCILVVHHVDEHRQAALHVALPEGVELVHRCEGHAFEHGAAGHCAVAEVGDHDALLAVDFLVESGTHRDGTAAAHDGVVGIDSEGSEEGVHASAQTLVEAGGAGENLGDCAVDEEADAEFLGVLALISLLGYFQGCSAPELFHDLLEFLFGEDLDAAQTLGEDFAVAAVAAEDEVVGVEIVSHTYGCSFLACGKVGRTGVVVFNTVVAARGLDQIEHGLELADGEHVAVDVQQVFLAEIALF